MNKQDAIEMLKSMLPEKISYAELIGAVGCYGNGGYVYADPEPYAIEMAISALEKQIPKKPITHDKTNRADCPVCEATVRGINKPYGDYCSGCGQKLDWSMEDE